MSETIRVELELTSDTPSSMTFADTYAGLANVWYRFSTDSDGNIELWATPDGYEHLARYFLKLARTNKVSGYHGHEPLEFGRSATGTDAELTIGVTDIREPVA